MKCIKYIGKEPIKEPTIQRVTNSYALILTNTGKWVYIPKHEWREFRDASDH